MPTLYGTSFLRCTNLPKLFCVDNTIVGEVEAKLVGQYNRTLLVNMVSQHIPECCKKALSMWDDNLCGHCTPTQGKTLLHVCSQSTHT